MTQLTITPKVADKTARFKGTVAAGEHVAVTIKGGAEWIGTDSGANLTLRVLDLVTGRTLAVFPYWTEDNSEDWPDDVTSADAWETSGDDNADLSCELNLNTLRMVAAARHMLRVPVMFVLGDTDDPRTLYFRDRYEVEYWPERIGDTAPYDLDKWPKQIDEWSEQVAAWTARMHNLALDAERVDGGVKITLNDGTLDEPKEVMVYDGEVSRDEMNTAIAAMGSTKQNTLTFDAIPTAESDNPVKSGGVYGAVDEVANAVAEHVGNTGIHVLAAQKTAWTAKYDKPQGGIPKSDLASAVQASLAKADTAVQVHQDISGKADKSDTYTKTETYSKDETNALVSGAVSGVFVVVASLPATGEANKIYLVPSEDAETGNVRDEYMWVNGAWELIGSTSVDLSDYYDKTAADGRFVQKETGKGLVAVDASLTTQGAAADAKAVGDALRSGFTEWVCDSISEGYEFVKCEWKTVAQVGTGWFVALESTPPPQGTPMNISVYVHGEPDDAVQLVWSGEVSFSLSRHPVAPTKTSQLVNDGEGTSAFVETNDTRLSDARTPTAHHATHAAGGSDPIAPADIGAASLSDLPYRLVEPGEWEFSGSGYDSSITYRMRWDAEQEEWLLEYYTGSEDPWHLVESKQGDQDDLVVDFDSNAITATRPSLPGHLLDRAVNAVSVTDATELTLPAANPGYARDFYVRLTVSATSAVTFSAQTGETITWDVMGDPSATFAAGTYLYRITEVAQGVFHAEDMMALVGLEAALAAINGGVAS